MLQNWHAGKYIVEVNAEYLCACTANIIFVKPLVAEMRSTIPICTANFAETCVNTGGDRRVNDLAL